VSERCKLTSVARINAYAWHDEQFSIHMEECSEARPRLGEKALSPEDGTELLWPRIAGDFERQALQTGSVAACQ
jgi:hypothetical protein